jgi:amino acid transporter
MTSPGLRANYLSLTESLAQTLGLVTPTGTIGLIIPLLILTAGNGTWLLLFIMLGMFLMIMLIIMRFASLHSSAGSIAAFSRLGWGPRGELIGGWIYLLGIGYCVPASMIIAGSYFDGALLPLLGPSNAVMRIAVWTTVLTFFCGLAAYKDIRMSSKLMLAIESISVTLMLCLIIVGMTHAHAWVDRQQMTLAGVHFSGMQGGLVLAFMLLAGFEGTTSLGEESRDPRRTIPRAIVCCMLPLTLLYLFMAYSIVALRNGGLIAVPGRGSPFDEIAAALHAPWLGVIASLGIAASYFACGLGSLTVASRVIYSMAKQGRFAARFGEAHPDNATPHRAIVLISVVSFAIPVGMLALGAEVEFSINFLSQLCSFGFIGGYLAVAGALPMYLRRQRLLTALDVGVVSIAASLLLVALVLSVYPAPAAPYNHVFHVFIGGALVGILFSARQGRIASRESPGGADARTDRYGRESTES